MQNVRAVSAFSYLCNQICICDSGISLSKILWSGTLIAFMMADICLTKQEEQKLMDNYNWSEDLVQVIGLSREVAHSWGLPEVGSGSLLVALLKRGGEVADLLKRMGLDGTKAAAAIADIESKELLLTSIGKKNDLPFFSTEGHRLLRRAQLEARSLGEQITKPEHLLLSMLHDNDNVAGKFLNDRGINFDNVAEKLGIRPSVRSTFGLTDDSPLPPTGGKQGGNGAAAGEKTDGADGAETPMLDMFGVDLTEKAETGVLDPVVGRQGETLRMAQILCRRKKNNPILIGQPGVGKSAVVEGLAQLIANRKAPHSLLGKRIVALDMAAVVAGTQFRGQFEERLRKLIEELRAHKEVVLFIDEIHTIIGAGSAAGTLDAANILKPALARGEVQCIGATTIDEYRKTIEKDGALERRFQKIMLEPATAEETLEILRNLKGRYEEHHGVKYTDQALEACVSLTVRYVTDRCLPDKAIDAMDEAGSRVHLTNVTVPREIRDKEAEIEALKVQKSKAAKNQDYELAARLRDAVNDLSKELEQMNRDWLATLGKDRIVVNDDDITEVVSMMCGVPAGKMKKNESERLRAMKDVLKRQVVAQDEAVEKLVRAITMSRIGLKGTDRPIGSFMFVGPTGVGKTHLVKCLAQYMFDSKDALIRIDMSEYGEKYSTSRLVGAPPGYVGYEEGGQLTERVRRHPYSVILLDEIEKAHPDVFNTLLQVMDEGRMTDGNGVTVDFRNTIIVMTSNSGTRQLGEFGNGVGFNAGENSADTGDSIIRRALKRQFSPEFLNRLDDVILFRPLNTESARQIARLELDALRSRLVKMGHNLLVTDELVDYVVTHGFEPQYGARSLKRAIKVHVEDALCDALMAGASLQGDIRFGVTDGKLTLQPVADISQN